MERFSLLFVSAAEPECSAGNTTLCRRGFAWNPPKRVRLRREGLPSSLNLGSLTDPQPIAEGWRVLTWNVCRLREGRSRILREVHEFRCHHPYFDFGTRLSLVQIYWHAASRGAPNGTGLTPGAPPRLRGQRLRPVSVLNVFHLSYHCTRSTTRTCLLTVRQARH